MLLCQVSYLQHPCFVLKVPKNKYPQQSRVLKELAKEFTEPLTQLSNKSQVTEDAVQRKKKGDLMPVIINDQQEGSGNYNPHETWLSSSGSGAGGEER